MTPNRQEELLDSLAINTFNMTIAEAHMKGVCIDCKEPAMENCYSEDGIKEYQKSGLCEKCFEGIILEWDE